MDERTKGSTPQYKLIETGGAANNYFPYDSLTRVTE